MQSNKTQIAMEREGKSVKIMVWLLEDDTVGAAIFRRESLPADRGDAVFNDGAATIRWSDRGAEEGGINIRLDIRRS
jgi:hypothetical protein